MPSALDWTRTRPTLAGALLYPAAVGLAVALSVGLFFVLGLLAVLLGLFGVWIALLAASWLGPHWAAKWSTTNAGKGLRRGALTHAVGICLAFPVYDLALPDESPGFVGRFVEFAFVLVPVGFPLALIGGARGGRAGARRRQASKAQPVYAESMSLLSTEANAGERPKP